MWLRRGLLIILLLISLPFTGCGEDDPSFGGPTPSASDPVDPSFQAAREACTFTGGDKVAETLGLSEAARASIPIKHVVVLMKENRSFDHIFGKLQDQEQPDTEQIPGDFQNPTTIL